EDLAKQLRELAASTAPLDPSEIVGGAQLVPLDSVQARDVSWLWPGRIARGKITLLVGDPGVGKSFLTLDLAAGVSRGCGWPDGSASCGSGEVILISAEDDLADTVQPRLSRAGADMSRITWLESVRTPLLDGSGATMTRAFTLDDLDGLQDALSR